MWAEGGILDRFLLNGCSHMQITNAMGFFNLKKNPFYFPKEIIVDDHDGFLSSLRWG